MVIRDHWLLVYFCQNASLALGVADTEHPRRMLLPVTWLYDVWLTVTVGTAVKYLIFTVFRYLTNYMLYDVMWCMCRYV